MSDDGVIYEVVVRRKAGGEVTGERLVCASTTPKAIASLYVYYTADWIEGLADELEDEARPKWRWEAGGLNNERQQLVNPDNVIVLDIENYACIHDAPETMARIANALNAMEDEA